MKGNSFHQGWESEDQPCAHYMPWRSAGRMLLCDADAVWVRISDAARARRRVQQRRWQRRWQFRCIADSVVAAMGYAERGADAIC